MKRVFNYILSSPFLVDIVSKELQKPSQTLAGRLTTKIMGKQNAFLESCAVKHLQISPHDKVLEIGFGAGVGLSCALSQVTDGDGQIFGVDYSEAVTKRAVKSYVLERMEGKLEIFLANVTFLPFPDKFLDKVFHCNCFYFWPDLDMANREIFRVMKPGAVMVAALYLDGLRKLQKSGALASAVSLDPVEFMLSLENVGFQDVKIDYFSYKDMLVYQIISAQKPEREADVPDYVIDEELEELKTSVSEEVRKHLMMKLRKPVDENAQRTDAKKNL